MRFYLSLLLILVCLAVDAQKPKKDKEYFYMFDSAWNSCAAEKASYMAYVQELDDTTFRWSYYNFTGPLLSVETYRDKDAKIPNGYFAWYDRDGRIVSSGYTVNGKKDRSWYMYSDTLTVIMQYNYDNGKLIKFIDYRDRSYRRPIPDSLPGDKEASFKGGMGAWSGYLQRNVQFPSRARNLNKTGKVMVDFTIDTFGKVEVSRISLSVEFSLDQEAVRLIRQSKNWIPAVQMGKNVNAYRRQPVNFAIPD